MPRQARTPLYYDRQLRRLWIAGQRCHHGATGVLLAGFGAAGLFALRRTETLAVVFAGSLLMVHDWDDRGCWFTRGWQDDHA
jgi:hypothetical protein